MTRERLTVVLFDRTDASDFVAIEDSDYDIAALTPSAYEAARARGGAVFSSSDLFSDRDQSRCVVAGRRAVRLVDTSTSLTAVPPSIRLMVRQSIWLMSFLEQRLRRTLRKGPWFVRDLQGAWVTAPDRHALLRVLLPRIWEYGLAHEIPSGQPPAPVLFRLLQRFAARAAGRSGSTWVAATTQKLRLGWREAIRDTGAALVVLQPTSGLLKDYRQTFASRGNITTLCVAPLSHDDPRVQKTMSVLRDFGSAIHDRNLAFSWSLYVPYLGKIVPTMLGFTVEGGHLLKLVGARAVLGFEANAWLNAALNEAAGAMKIPRVVLNHNSQPPSGGATADDVLFTLYQHRTFNDLVDFAGIWSPSGLQWAEHKPRQQVQCQPVRIDYPASDSRPAAGRPFRILHAGNYQNWSDYFPWVSETSEEFLSGMERLARASAAVEGIEIVFRIRPKREVDAETLRRRLKARPNLRVCDTEEDFLQQLADSDLLVAHFSTTVEQALQMGKPVLLWGNARRYRQFEGRITLPDPQSRAPVYIVPDEKNLPAMLAAIRDAHHGRPLTEEETGCYRHPPGTPSVGEWTRDLLHPGRRI